MKPHKLSRGTFHASVMSPSRNRAETFALAIDQLRLLRNTLCHSTSSEIDKPTFDQYVQLSEDAFKALGVKTDPIGAIGGLTESDFPTNEVRKLQQAMKDESQAYLKFLEGMSSEIDAIKGKVEGSASKEDIASLEQKINDLSQILSQDKQGKKVSYNTASTCRSAQSKFMTCRVDKFITPWTPVNSLRLNEECEEVNYH